MSAGNYDFKIEQGTSFTLSLVYKDNLGNVVNLTDYCARLIWKTNTGITQIFTTDNNDYSQYKFSIDAPNGQLSLKWPAHTTNDFDFKNAKYDLELQSPAELYPGGGKVTLRILSGIVTIIKRYSQAASNLECAE